MDGFKIVWTALAVGTAITVLSLLGAWIKSPKPVTGYYITQQWVGKAHTCLVTQIAWGQDQVSLCKDDPAEMAKLLLELQRPEQGLPATVQQ